MNKAGHIFVTGQTLKGDYQGYRRWLLFGSILPDLLFHTYLIGHTWNATFQKTIRGMARLEKWGEMGALSCIGLGYYLHFIEDYFTFPHNTNFRGGFVAHVIYEKRFTEHLMQSWQVRKEGAQVTDLKQLQDELIRLHEGYMAQDMPEFDCDERYIYEAADCVLTYFATVLQRNRKVLDAARLEAFYIAQDGLMGGRHETV